jgi:hypothetical protein
VESPSRGISQPASSNRSCITCVPASVMIAWPPHNLATLPTFFLQVAKSFKTCQRIRAPVHDAPRPEKSDSLGIDKSTSKSHFCPSNAHLDAMRSCQLLTASRHCIRRQAPFGRFPECRFDTGGSPCHHPARSRAIDGRALARSGMVWWTANFHAQAGAW